jgi:hypothetical protein
MACKIKHRLQAKTGDIQVISQLW